MSQTGTEHGAPGADDRLTSVLRPVRAGNGFEEALEQILQVVRLGLVPGGERLPAERELADRLGISRVTLREALARTHDAPHAEYRRLDTLLHLTLAELSGSPTLTAQYAAVRATVNDLLDCIPLLVRNLEHSQRQHTALVEAVIEGNAECAREIMREHCGGTAALLRGFLG